MTDILRDRPHFPALRSDPMALSGASRRKQIPSSQPAENITLTILKGAGSYGFGHLNANHKMISLDVNNQEANGWAKTQEHKGVRILLKEELDKGIQMSQLEYIKDNRYHITLSGRRYNSKKSLQAKEDLEKIKF